MSKSKPLDYAFIRELVEKGTPDWKIGEALGFKVVEKLYGGKVVRRCDKIKQLKKKDPEFKAALDRSNTRKQNEKEIDYQLVRKLVGIGCNEYEIADAIGYSVRTRYMDGKLKKDCSAFTERKKRDPELTEALQSLAGDRSLKHQVWRTAFDRYHTMCKDCGKISEGEFLQACKYCNSDAVRHKFIPGNTIMMIWLTKQRFHWSDKVAIIEDEEADNSGLAEMRRDLKAKRGARIASHETI